MAHASGIVCPGATSTATTDALRARRVRRLPRTIGTAPKRTDAVTQPTGGTMKVVSDAIDVACL
jgi:hypothetical protein